MPLQDSLLSSVQLRQKPKRFVTLLGVSVEQFDSIFEKLYELELEFHYSRHRLWRKERVDKMVANNVENLREYLCITLLYLRQYNIQEVIAASFDISQSRVSRIVNRISVMLEMILPVPEKVVESLTGHLQKLDPKIREKYAATLIIDASEQRVERNQDAEKQKLDYSGKKNVTAENSS